MKYIIGLLLIFSIIACMPRQTYKPLPPPETIHMYVYQVTIHPPFKPAVDVWAYVLYGSENFYYYESKADIDIFNEANFRVSKEMPFKLNSPDVKSETIREIDPRILPKALQADLKDDIDINAQEESQ